MKKMMNKKILYVEWLDACCGFDYKNHETYTKSHEKMLADGDVVALVYLVDEITGNEWGDDWNDAPMCSNAGAPYSDRCKGLEILELKLGDTIFKSK